MTATKTNLDGGWGGLMERREHSAASAERGSVLGDAEADPARQSSQVRIGGSTRVATRIAVLQAGHRSGLERKSRS